MAVFTGISGTEIYDTSGGKVALSLVEADILRTLSSSTDSFVVFNARNGLVSDNIEAGSVYFRLLKIIGVSSYTPSYQTSDLPTLDQIRVDLDQNQVISYEIPDYDMERIKTAGQLRSRLAENGSLAIRKNLNAQFLMKIKAEVDAENIEAIAVPNLIDNTATTDEVKADAFSIYYKALELSTKYDGYALGTEFNEFKAVVNPYALANLLRSYTNPMNTGKAIDIQVLGRRVVAQELWGIGYLVDDLLNTSIALGTSFNKDYAVDTTNLVGWIGHIEALSFPYRMISTKTRTASNFNIQLGTKFQWGFKVLRPTKICGLVKEAINNQ